VVNTILKLDPRPWAKDDGTVVKVYWVSLEGHPKDVPCYDERGKDLAVGTPLPDGWAIKQSKAGKDYLAAPGKPAGGKREYVPRYTDTREGFDAEQERVDRRRALEYAVAIGSGITTELAEKFYVWLRAPLASVSALAEGSKTREAVGTGTAPVIPPAGADTPLSESGINAPAAPAANTGGWDTPQPDSDTTSTPVRAGQRDTATPADNPALNADRDGALRTGVDATSALESGTVKGKDSDPGSGAALHRTSEECTEAECGWKPPPSPAMAKAGWLVSTCGNVKKAGE